MTWRAATIRQNFASDLPESARTLHRVRACWYPWAARSKLGHSMDKLVFVTLALMLACAHPQVRAAVGHPEPGRLELPIWPSTPPDAQPAPGPQTEWSNIVRPSITVYSPTVENTGVAVVVFPGGGFEGLAIKGEG